MALTVKLITVEEAWQYRRPCNIISPYLWFIFLWTILLWWRRHWDENDGGRDCAVL